VLEPEELVVDFVTVAELEGVVIVDVLEGVPTGEDPPVQTGGPG
jgi:hypothetical protein